MASTRYITAHYILQPTSRTDSRRKRVWFAAYLWQSVSQDPAMAAEMTKLSVGLFASLHHAAPTGNGLRLADMLMNSYDQDYAHWCEQALHL